MTQCGSRLLHRIRKHQQHQQEARDFSMMDTWVASAGDLWGGGVGCTGGLGITPLLLMIMQLHLVPLVWTREQEVGDNRDLREDGRLGDGCYDCPRADHNRVIRQVNSQCKYPCKCSNSNIQCKSSVNIIRDGCECCHMCARQQGDICTYKDKCDEDKGLYCDMDQGDGQTGICRAKIAAPCEVNGVTYKDGEEFKPTCNQHCSCQNGIYACTSTCPHEDHQPSSVYCNVPKLISIQGRCCKEWICPNSHSRPETDDDLYQPNDVSEKGGVTTVPIPGPENCKKQTHPWSACSATCDMGISVRVTNDNAKCQPVEEKRLCFIRPCDYDDSNKLGKDCKSTWKETPLQYLQYNGCRSVEQYKLKYCSTCKKDKCCGPGRTKTIDMQFRCKDNTSRNQLFQFMWIKNCECGISCPEQ